MLGNEINSFCLFHCPPLPSHDWLLLLILPSVGEEEEGGQKEGRWGVQERAYMTGAVINWLCALWMFKVASSGEIFSCVPWWPYPCSLSSAFPLTSLMCFIAIPSYLLGPPPAASLLKPYLSNPLKMILLGQINSDPRAAFPHLWP